MDYKTRLNELKNCTTIIQNKYKQSIILKEGSNGKQGGLDEQVVANSKNAPSFGAEKGAKKPSIEFIRSIMGWDNHDVTNGKIGRKEISIPTSNGQVTAYVYENNDGKIKPCLVFFHGGGFFGGTLKCVENPCKALAMYGDIKVVSVEYALAPENPYPKGFNDCFESVKYVYDNAESLGIDKTKIGVAGDSAGANLACVCTLKDMDEGANMICYQGLLYPTINISHAENEWFEWNIDEYNITHDVELTSNAVLGLGRDKSRLVNIYLNGDATNAKDRYVSPLFADVSNMPPTVIINAEFDYLRLEGEALGRKLAEAGTDVTMIRYEGMDHAFMDKIGEYPQAEDSMREIAFRFRSVVD